MMQVMKLEKLEVKEWMAINRVIYKIYGEEMFDVMRSDFLEHINMFIDFDSAYFYIADKDNQLIFEKPAVFQCEAPDKINLNGVPDLAEIVQNKKSIVFRETDIVEREAWPSTQNYKLYYRPNNWHYGMRLIIAKDKRILGMVTLFRSISKKNFDINDVLMLDLFKDHLALRLSNELNAKKNINVASSVSFDKTAEKYELTKKERVVLEMLSHGESAEQISGQLDVSVNTVKKHTVNIYRKLGINKRIQLFQMFSG